MIRKFVILLILVGSGWNVVFGQNLIVNDTFDTDVAGWETTSASTGIAEWEPDLGQPPGSLRLVGPDEIALTERCYRAFPGRYYLRADGYMRTVDDDLFCAIDWAIYSSRDCTGFFGVFTYPPVGSWVVNPNQWESLEYEFTASVGGGLIGETHHSLRPFLNKFGDYQGDDACVFDNVYLEIEPTPTIPTLSPVGLTLLIALMLTAGFVVLRRRSAGNA